jgi:acetyl-CoA acetyltransferase
MKKVYIHNPQLSRFGKTLDSVQSLSVKTAKKTLESFDKQTDLFVFSSFAPEVYTKEFHLAAKIASELKLEDATCLRVETASSSGAAAVTMAYNLLASGAFKNALLIGTEVMSRLNREDNNILLGSVLSVSQQMFAMSMAQGAALLCQRYLSEYGYSKDDLFFIAEKLHSNGFANEFAHIRKKISFSDYQNAPQFATPLGLYDISPLSDGSASFLLSTEMESEFAIKGVGSGTSHFYSTPSSPSFTASRQAFQKAYTQAGIKPSQVEIAELHDAFTLFEVIGAEDAQIFPIGKGLKYVKDGITHLDGKVIINGSGGLKTRGHPIGASGVAQIVEITKLMKAKQKKIGLTHSIGGLATNNFVCILEYTPK